MTEQLLTPVVFLDFDGTISRRDAIDAILEEYASPQWLAIEEEWRAGRIGSRQCLSAQMQLVRATQSELDALLDTIMVDEGFPLLLETCEAHHATAHIISDGFDYCIRRILARRDLASAAHRLDHMRICSSHLEPVGDGGGPSGWRVEFPFFPKPCAHGCATCKPAVMQWLNPAGAPTVFIGDGLSDRYAALHADLVFAKQNLATYCREQKVAYIAYDNLGEVAARLDDMLRAGALDRAEEVTAVGA